MLKGILKDQEFTSSDEVEEMITRTWTDLTFDDVQNVFWNWVSRLTWVIGNSGEYVHK